MAANGQAYIPASQDVVCPPAFDLVGKRCEQASFLPAIFSCALGSLQGGQCVTTAPQISQCPYGSIAEGGSCKIIANSTPNRTCPGGYSAEGGACIQRIPLPIEEVCELGRPDGNGNCIFSETVSKVMKQTCPSGYNNEGYGCVKTTQYDCSPAASAPPPPPHFAPAAVPVPMQRAAYGKGAAPLPAFGGGYGGHGGHKRMLGGKKGGYSAPISLAPPMAIAAPVTPQNPWVPLATSNIAVLKQMCQRQDYAPLITEQFCPNGYADAGGMGGQCVTTSTYPMIKRCVNGNSAQNCYDIKTAPFFSQCANGSLVGERCVAATTVPQETVCPAGTKMSGIGGACEQYQQPHQSCPTGHSLDGAGNCIGKIYAEPSGTVMTRCTGKGCFKH